MRKWAIPVACVLASSAGAAVATQTPSSRVHIDSAQALNACMSPEEQRRPEAQFSAAQKRRIVACINADAARQANAQLPAQVDEITRLVRMTSSGPTLTYHYTIARRLAEMPANVRDLIETATRAYVCGQQNMVHTMQMGGVYAYRWLDPDGRLIDQIQITGC